jgi:hypothetical protein
MEKSEKERIYMRREEGESEKNFGTKRLFSGLMLPGLGTRPPDPKSGVPSFSGAAI